MNIYIWGTGRLVGKVLGRYILLDNVEGFIDNNTEKITYMGKKVISPNELLTIDYDAVVVANLYSKDIYSQCIELGLDIKKFIFLYANCYLEDFNSDYAFVEKILGKTYADIVKNRYHVVRDLDISEGELCFKNWNRIQNNYSENDWVRIKTFELVVKEIKKRKIEGAVAELGVFRGEFAQYINYAFPDDKLYLFDTFEGFNANEALNEIKSGNCTEAFVEAYKNTTISEVLKKMTRLDNIIIKQGMFPDSLGDLEDTFKFVSIDLDFENSIYEGLEYFYPRLVHGGYIFIHDYNSCLLGVERAVDKFEKKLGINLSKFPVSDANGTIVITK